ncbi:MAG TPA: hypothetical protein VNJ29_01030, partial [Candidatus Nitrosotenuis sp.]|nr:hypothetical protein [Candidatus Nitrosotenuis sp.]
MLNTLKKLGLCVLFLSFSMEVPAQDKNNPERPSYTYTYPTTLSPSYVAMFESEYSPPSYVYDIT